MAEGFTPEKINDDETNDEILLDIKNTKSKGVLNQTKVNRQKTNLVLFACQ